jgi:hypothetical protein
MHKRDYSALLSTHPNQDDAGLAPGDLFLPYQPGEISEGTNLSLVAHHHENLFINNYRKKAKTRVYLIPPTTFFLNSGSNSAGNQGESNILMDELTHMVDELDEPSVSFSNIRRIQYQKSLTI